MSYCDGLLIEDIQPSCDSPVVGGIEKNGIIINRKDIDFAHVEFEEKRNNVITALPLKKGKKGYSIYVPTNAPFTGTTTTMEVGTNRNSFTNNVGFVVLDNDPDVCRNVIDSLASGEFVIVYENKYKNLHKKKDNTSGSGLIATPGDSTFQVVGYYQGLKAETLENDKYSEDTEGGWNVLLSEKKVPKSALFLYSDKDGYRALFESLLEEVQ